MNHIRPVFLTLAFTASMLLSTSIAITPATAAPVTFAFTGVVNNVAPGLFTSGGNFNGSQKLSGFYTFNDATLDSNPSGRIGRYNDTITALTVQLGPASGPPSYTATLGPETPGNNNFIQIRNQPSGVDGYEVRAPVTGPSVNGFSPLYFRIELIDPSHTVFSNDSLPTTPPSLSSFATNTWRLVFTDGNGNARIQGSLTSATLVPLPAAVILFGAGLVALVGLGAGSWRQNKNTIA